jgi:hypothetical protein
MFRWYIPGRYHTPVAPEDKARLRAEGRAFRETWGRLHRRAIDVRERTEDAAIARQC